MRICVEPWNGGTTIPVRRAIRVYGAKLGFQFQGSIRSTPPVTSYCIQGFVVVEVLLAFSCLRLFSLVRVRGCCYPQCLLASGWGGGA